MCYQLTGWTWEVQKPIRRLIIQYSFQVQGRLLRTLPFAVNIKLSFCLVNGFGVFFPKTGKKKTSELLCPSLNEGLKKWTLTPKNNNSIHKKDDKYLNFYIYLILQIFEISLSNIDILSN